MYNGTTWSAPEAIDSSSSYLNSVSCYSATVCQAVDNVGNLITYRNGSWHKPVSIDGQNYISAIDCLTATSCVAADGNGLVMQLNGDTVQYREQFKRYFLSKWLSCPSLSWCLMLNQSSEWSVGRS